MLELLANLNPWWAARTSYFLQQVTIERRAVDSLFRRVSDPLNPRATLLLGPRQVGKTTAVHQVIDRALKAGISPHNLVYLDFDNPELRRLGLRGSLDLVAGGIRRDEPHVFALDEIQRVEQWPEDLKFLVDRGLRHVILTGSASSTIFSQFEESLQGRCDVALMRGLDFGEFLEMRRRASSPAEPSEPTPRALIRDHLLDYLALGGLPQHVLDRDVAAVRHRIREDILTKAISHDIVAIHEIRSPLSLEDLFQRVMEHPGAILNVDKLSKSMRTSRTTIEQWLRAFEQASLIERLPNITSGGRRSHARGAMPKVYPIDPALASAFAPDSGRGAAAECAVHGHLAGFVERLQRRQPGRVTLGYWRERGSDEADFYVAGGDRSLLVEVTTASTLRTEEIAKFVRACHKLEPSRAVIACLESRGRRIQRSPLPVHVVPLDEFLMACSDPSVETIEALVP